VYTSHSAPLEAPGRSGTPGGTSALAPTDPRPAGLGRTPLLRLRRVAPELGPDVELWGKAEFLNPTGSVKDRAASHIVAAALASGELLGKTLVDASSGNTGISYAMLGARLGFPVEICLPRNASPERIRQLSGFGARIVFTDPAEGTDGAQREARRRVTAEPDRYYYPDQYNHPANPDAHYTGTGPEIWAQTAGRVTHLVAGVGTGGTVSGIGRFLKGVDLKVQILGVEPDGPLHGIEGLKHLPTALRPGTYDPRWVDGTIRVATETAQSMSRALARQEGLFVGTSSGAAVAAMVSIATSVAPPAVLVAILPDGGDRYLSERHWEEGT
jgi:cysteine synthase B